jgi:hypothetical protein
MKLYQVNYVGYYDDFGGGGEYTKGSWLYQSKENAIKKIAEIKPEIYEEFKETLEDLEQVEFVDTPECYTIREDGGMCYWGSSVYIEEIETED